MKKSKQILFALSSFALVFSTVANVVINVNAVESKNENAVSSVKDAISKLIESKNYTIEVSTKIGPLDMVYDVYYTENGFYDSFLGDEYGYVSVDEGVFSFDLYNRKFTASKLLKDEEGNNIKSIWGTDLIPSFADFRINQFKDATGKEYVTSKKIDQIAVLSILKLDITNYNTSNTIKFSVGEDMNSFKFEYSLQNGKHYECSIKDFGTTVTILPSMPTLFPSTPNSLTIPLIPHSCSAQKSAPRLKPTNLSSIFITSASFACLIFLSPFLLKSQ